VENFLRRKKNEQIELLKTLSGRKKELDLLDIERKKAYEDRTDVNRKVSEYEGKLKGQELGEMLKAIDTSDIYSQMQNVGKEVELYVRAESGKAERLDKLNDNLSAIEGYREKIKALELENTTLKAEIEKADAWLKKREKPSGEQISEKLKAAEEHNAKVKIQEALIAQHQELQYYKKASVSLTNKLADIDREKAEILSSSSLPVEGLSFDDDGVYLNGLPFEEGQINTAKIYEVGFHIFRALGSNFRVMKLDMNSMDKDTFERIVDLAGEDIQLIFEKVGWDAEEGVEIKFTEEIL
jgi:regulator of replication initiation timing